MKTLDVLETVLRGKRIKESTKKHYRQALTSLSEYSEEFPVNGVVIEEWLATLVNYADETVGLMYDKVRAAGKYMKKPPYKLINPCEETDRPKVMKKQRRYHEVDELMQVLAACRFGYDRELVLTFIDSGCRAIDLANLKSGDIADGYFTATGKTGESKYRLDPRICVALKNLAGSDDNYVFTSGVSRWGTGNKMTSGGLSMRVRRICKRAGLTGEKLGSHTLRHSVGSLIVDETLSPLAVKAILQQEKVDTAMIYIHDAEEKIHRKLSPLQLISDRVLNGKNGQEENGGHKQLELADSIDESSTALTIAEQEIIPLEDESFYQDMFPEVQDDIEIRPLLKSEDLRLVRRIFVDYSRHGGNHLDMLKARELMKRMLRKVK